MKPGLAGQPMQKVIVYVTDPASQCYVEGCTGPKEFTCHAMYCCKDYGCGKRMCRDHRSKKCFMQEKNSPPPNVCIECEDKVSEYSNERISIFVVFSIILICFFCVFFFGGFIGNSENNNKSQNDNRSRTY